MSALAIHPLMIPTPMVRVDDASARSPHVIGDALAARALASVRTRWGLTARECQVIALLADGDGNKEIATKLACAIRTVEAHVTSILKKARCESRTRVMAHFWRG